MLSLVTWKGRPLGSGRGQCQRLGIVGLLSWVVMQCVIACSLSRRGPRERGEYSPKPQEPDTSLQSSARHLPVASAGGLSHLRPRTAMRPAQGPRVLLLLAALSLLQIQAQGK